MSGQHTRAHNVKACKDCLAELPEAVRDHPIIKGLRPAPFPGPRCHSHHRAFQLQTKSREHARKKEAQFGLPPDGYATMLEHQQGACGGCGKTPGAKARRMAVDHDHTCCPGNESCGQCVRGLLCYRCNETLANFRDDEFGLLRLAEYLKNWPTATIEWTRTPDGTEGNYEPSVPEESTL